MRASRLPRRIVCTIIRIDGAAPQNATVDRISGFAPLAADRLANPNNRLAPRPSELVPWADPYIAGLVKRLQNDVRREREASGEADALAPPTAELDPPCVTPAFEWEDESWEPTRWSDFENN